MREVATFSVSRLSVWGQPSRSIGRRAPACEVVHDSDGGTQDASLRFASHLEDYGLIASFDSTGDAYDAAMEAFWAQNIRSARR